MTSKSSYSDELPSKQQAYISLGTLMREDIKRRLWPIALSVLGCIFALPVFSMLYMNLWFERLANRATTLPDIARSFYLETLSYGNIPLLLFICGLAVVNGVHGMMYMHNRVKSDFYDSLPVKRTRLFTAAYLNGILIFVIPYIAFHALTVLIGLSRGLMTGQTFIYGLASILIVSVLYSCIYTLSVLASVLCGNTIVAIMGAGVLNGIIAAYYGLFFTYRLAFFNTYYESTEYDYGEVFLPQLPVPALIPLRARLGELVDQRIVAVPGKALLFAGVYLALTVALYFLLRKLLMIRPSEASGKAIAFPKIKPFLKVVLLIPIILYSAMIFYGIAGSRWTWMLFGAVMGTLIGHAFIEIIYEFDFKACFKHAGTMAAGFAISIAFACIFIFDIFGYESYRPDPDKIESVAFACDGMHSNIDYYEPDSFGNRNYVNQNDYRLDHMELKDAGLVDEIVKQGISYVEATRLLKIFKSGNDYYNMDVTEDEAEYFRSRGISIALPDESTGFVPRYYYTYVKYHLKNGRDVYRQYLVNYNDDAIMGAVSEIYAQDEYKECVFPVLTADNSEIGELYYGNPREETVLKDIDRDRFMDAYRKELYAQALSELSEEYAACYVVSRTYNKEYRYYDDQYYMYIYPSFKETIAILEEAGVKPLDIYSPEGITEIDINAYDMEWNSTASFTDKKDIEEIMGNVVYDSYYYMDRALHEEVDQNMNVEAFYENSEEGRAVSQYYQTSYYFLPGSVPGFVEDAIEANKISGGEEYEE